VILLGLSILPHLSDLAAGSCSSAGFRAGGGRGRSSGPPFAFQRSVKKTLIARLGQLDFLLGRENALLLGSPGAGETYLVTARDSRVSRRPAL